MLESCATSEQNRGEMRAAQRRDESRGETRAEQKLDENRAETRREQYRGSATAEAEPETEAEERRGGRGEGDGAEAKTGRVPCDEREQNASRKRWKCAFLYRNAQLRASQTLRARQGRRSSSASNAINWSGTRARLHEARARAGSRIITAKSKRAQEQSAPRNEGHLHM